MTERLLVYRVQTWRHVCYLPTLEEALAHARIDLDRARPGEVAITRQRVSRAFWDGLPKDCDHPELRLLVDEEGPDGGDEDDTAPEPPDGP